MYKTLASIKKSGESAGFLFPSLDSVVVGTITTLTASKIVVEHTVGRQTFQYATHPHNVVLVSRKPKAE
jgi:hypothetical protein